MIDFDSGRDGGNRRLEIMEKLNQAGGSSITIAISGAAILRTTGRICVSMRILEFRRMYQIETIKVYTSLSNFYAKFVHKIN